MGYVNEAILKDFKYLKQIYPELNMCGLEVNPRTATGTVILPELRSKPREVRAEFEFPIMLKYSDLFPIKAIKVFDLKKRIKWDAIAPEHRHTFGGGEICTHHPHLLKLVRHQENQSVLIVRSAILIYFAYRECVETGKWPAQYKDLPHGNAADHIIARDLRKV